MAVFARSAKAPTVSAITHHSGRVSLPDGWDLFKKTAEQRSDRIAPPATSAGVKDPRLRRVTEASDTRAMRTTSAKKYASRAVG